MVVKFEKKKFAFLKEDIKKKLGNECIIYRPKILIQKYKNNKLVNQEVDLLGDYLFCYHQKLKEKPYMNQMQFIRGIKYILNGFIQFQSDLNNFIDRCKKLENEKGFISQNLFELKVNSKYKFYSGPFTDKIFEIVNFQKNKINILMGKIKTTIKKREYLFSLV